MDLVNVISQIQRTLNPVLEKFVQPQKLSRMATALPHRFNFAIVQKILNKAFAEQLADGDFNFFSGRKLQIEITDAGLFIGLGHSHNKISCDHFDLYACQSDVTLSIDSLNAIRLIQQEIDPDTLFFQRRLKINGDTELAHHVKNTIDTLDPEIIPPLIMKMISLYRQQILD